MDEGIDVTYDDEHYGFLLYLASTYPNFIYLLLN